MADLLSLGLSGLHAAKTNLSVVGHNIANVNTPGYSRQQAIQDSRPPQFTGGGYMGSGSNITDVRRIYSEFLTAQLRTSTAHNSDIQAYKSQIDQLDSLLAGSTTGITPAMKSFFSAMQTAAEDPANMPARQLVLAESEGLARRFNNIYENIHAQNEFINKQMVVIGDQVNRLAAGIAEMNDAILQSSSRGHPPNDLLDKRDEAIRELATFVGIKVVPQDDNSLNIFMGSGQPLVLGAQANSLEVVPGKADPSSYDVNFVSGHTKVNVNNLLTGGEIGGLLRYRNEVLDPTLNAMGRLALSIGDEINRQLGQGLDLKGNVGAALFNDKNDPKLQGLRVLPMGDNAAPITGGKLEITNTQLLTASDYRIDYDGTNYSAKRLSDGAVMVIVPEASGGMRLEDLEGRDQGFVLTFDDDTAFSAGDSFVLQPTRRGANDISSVLDQADQLAFAAPLRSEADLQNKGTGVIGQPSVEMVLNDLPLGGSLADNFVTDELVKENLEAVGEITLKYEGGHLVFGRVDSAGQFVALDPTDPNESVRITEMPQEGELAPDNMVFMPFTPGQTNTLNYAIEVEVGGVKQSYTVSQTLSGRPTEGDTFSVSFNKSGVSDNRNALKLADLQNKQVVGVDANHKDLTGMSFTDDYGKSIENVGTLAAQARRDEEASSAVLKMATDNRDSLSGVNLDEEAANLIRFEQYYNASAQMIQVARSLFDTLISTVR